ncbi:hypothetical protein G9C98_005942 [Cotesia typhae]|uniref:Lipocalin/cytosolic fatty-acid binding domain-containing protein n=1 Tax=Cotesia typhae TaxID=2053667 RepID=A0A8J5R9T7_9HYME|nr:hypothetical protein G9C98_005942 [Cotesia typhae]
MIRTLVAFCLIVGAFANSDFGPCPQVPSEYVDVNRYAGTWYTYEQSCGDCTNLTKCSQASWSKPDQNGNSTVIISEFSEISFSLSAVTSRAYIEEKKIINEICVPAVGTVRLEFWILATDYDTYSIVYNCKPVIVGVIYTRTRQIDFNMTAIAQNVYNFQKIEMPTMYAGEWRNYQQSHNNIFHFGYCHTSYWFEPENGTSKAVVTSYSTIKKEYDTTILADSFNNGHNLGMNFELPVLGNLYREYYIRTDYENYALAWNCVKENNTRVLYANVFLRGDKPKVDIEKIKRRVFGEMGLEIPQMDQVDRRGCPPFSQRSLRRSLKN